MIDEDKTFEKFGYRSNELSRYSHKKVVCLCDGCGDARDSEFHQIRDLCHLCSCRTSENREIARKRAIHQWERGEHDNISQMMIGNKNALGHIMTEEARELNRLKGISQFESRHSRDEMSVIIKNSDAHKKGVEKFKGGDDICNHHYIYDHSDLTKYTMKITRSNHQKLHWLLRNAGIMIPHINITTGDD